MQPKAASVTRVVEADKLPANLPTADQLIDCYIQALGGATAEIDKDHQPHENRARQRLRLGGQTVGFESPAVRIRTNKLSIRHMLAGDSFTVFNGHEGWFRIMPGRPSCAKCTAADLDAARMDARPAVAASH